MFWFYYRYMLDEENSIKVFRLAPQIYQFVLFYITILPKQYPYSSKYKNKPRHINIFIIMLLNHTFQGRWVHCYK